MGCGASLPKPEEFLVAQSGVVPLMPAPTSIKMDGWPVAMGYTESEEQYHHDEINALIDMVETNMRARAQPGSPTRGPALPTSGRVDCAAPRQSITHGCRTQTRRLRMCRK